MLPHNHFLIAGLVIAPAAAIFYPEKTITEVGMWVLVGGLVSAAIDLDIYAIVILKTKKENRLKPFINPLEIYRNFESFMDTIFKTGLWKIGLATHLVVSALLILIFYVFSNGYFMPVVLGVMSHIISDIPNLKRIKGGPLKIKK